MSPATPSHLSSSWKFLAFISGVLTAAATLLQGQDANWDLRNYHLYTSTALMSGRYADDIAAGQLQTWHNPALDFPFAWMAQAGWPGWVITLWLALPAFFCVLFALRIMDIAWPTNRSMFRTIVAALVALTGAAVMPSLGTTLNDAFVGAGMLGAVCWILSSQHRRSIWMTWIPAGLFAGMAAGLKLTGAIYCIGLAAAAVAAIGWRHAPLRLVALAMGGVLGVCIAAGPWAILMWQEHGNPLFPYFNDWFQSPDAPPVPFKDERFQPRTFLDALYAPVRMWFPSDRFSELKLADTRLSLGLLALLGSWFATRKSGDATLRMLAVFVVTSLVVWLKLYGIYRYVFAMEVLCSIAIIGAATYFLPLRGKSAGMVLIALLVIATTRHPSWGRTAFTTPMVSVEMPTLPSDSLIVLANDQPLGYAAAFIPRHIPVIAVHNNFMDPSYCSRLQARSEARIREHTGAVMLLREPGPEPAQAAWESYGLSRTESCTPIQSNLGALELCPLQRASRPSVQCALR